MRFSHPLHDAARSKNVVTAAANEIARQARIVRVVIPPNAEPGANVTGSIHKVIHFLWFRLASRILLKRGGTGATCA